MTKVTIISNFDADATRINYKNARFFGSISIATYNAITPKQANDYFLATDDNALYIWNGSALVAAGGGLNFQITENLTTWTGLFDKNYIVATVALPTTGNITYNFTGGVVGAKIIIFHNSATAPTFPAQTRFKDGLYIPSVVNRIELSYDVASTIVTATISQPSTLVIPDVKQGYSLILQTNPSGGTAFGSGTSAIAGSSSLGIIDRLTIGDAQSRGKTPISTGLFKPNSCNWVIDQKIKTPSALSDGTDRYVIFIGSATTVTNSYNSSNRCGVVYSDDINSGKFALQLKNDDSFDTGITVAADTEYHIILEHRVDTGLNLWINGAFIGNFDGTNVSSSDSRPLYSIVKLLGAGSIVADFGALNFGVYDY